jgi:hypothetical protein
MVFLKVSRRGIEYHSTQLVIQTNWENVESLIADPINPALGLARRAATHMRPLLGRDLSSGRHIPLSAFGYSPHSALAQDLRRISMPNMREHGACLQFLKSLPPLIVWYHRRAEHGIGTLPLIGA